jgi:hypothetical protein
MVHRRYLSSLKPLLQRLERKCLAPPLAINDILLNCDKTKFFNKSLTHCLLRIIITHGGEKFNKFRADLERTQPVTKHKIELHKTPLHPLPAMNIDESTITGNDEVVTAIHKELEITEDDHEQGIKIFCGDHATCVKVFAGDQLSIARLRALASIRTGQENGFWVTIGGVDARSLPRKDMRQPWQFRYSLG